MGSFKSKNRFECNFDKIEDNLYLGNLKAALNAKLLHQLNVNLVLSILLEPIEEEEKVKNIGYKLICANDNKSYDLLTHFPDCIQYIAKGEENGGNVLVNCKAGISRSSTIVIAFLMNKYKMSYSEARKQVKQKRPIINPNRGFVKQLKLFQEMNFTLNANNVRFRRYLFKKTMIESKKYNTFIDIHSYLQKLSIAERMTKNLYLGDAFECIKCGFILFNEINLIQYKIRSKYFKKKNRKECDFVYIEPKYWMSELDFDVIVGRIQCPECDEVLGRYELPFNKPISCYCRSHVGLNYRSFEVKKNKFRIQTNK